MRINSFFKISLLLLILVIAVGSVAASDEISDIVDIDDDTSDIQITDDDSMDDYFDDDLSDDGLDDDLGDDDSDDDLEDDFEDDEDLDDDDWDDDEDLDDEDWDDDSDDDEDFDDEDWDDEDWDDDDLDDDDWDDEDWDDDDWDDEDWDDDYDPVEYTVKSYITFYKSHFKKSMALNFDNDTSLKREYGLLYNYINSTFTEDDDVYGYESFKNITKFYMKSVENRTDDELNRSEEFYNDLYDKFMDEFVKLSVMYKAGGFAAGMDIAGADSQPFYKVLPANDILNNNYLQNIETNSTCNDNNTNTTTIQHIQQEDSNPILIVLLCLILIVLVIV